MLAAFIRTLHETKSSHQDPAETFCQVQDVVGALGELCCYSDSMHTAIDEVSLSMIFKRTLSRTSQGKNRITKIIVPKCVHTECKYMVVR